MVEILKIVGAHGIKGAVRAVLYSDDLEKYAALCDAQGHFFKFRVIKYPKNGGSAVIALEGVSDRNAAEALVGTELFISQDDLPRLDEDEFSVYDLIGRDLPIEGTNETCKVISVQNFGASDLIELVRSEGKSFYVPFTKSNFLGKSAENLKISQEAIENYDIN